MSSFRRKERTFPTDRFWFDRDRDEPINSKDEWKPSSNISGKKMIAADYMDDLDHEEW